MLSQSSLHFMQIVERSNLPEFINVSIIYRNWNAYIQASSGFLPNYILMPQNAEQDCFHQTHKNANF